MVNYKTFTRALTLFCLLVFLYTIIPQNYNWIESILKYILISLFAILFILGLEITDSIPSLQNSQSNNVVNNKNVLDDKNINKKLNVEDPLKTNFTDLKKDTIKKEKIDFSRNIKYVND